MEKQGGLTRRRLSGQSEPRTSFETTEPVARAAEVVVWVGGCVGYVGWVSVGERELEESTLRLAAMLQRWSLLPVSRKSVLTFCGTPSRAAKPQHKASEPRCRGEEL